MPCPFFIMEKVIIDKLSARTRCYPRILIIDGDGFRVEDVPCEIEVAEGFWYATGEITEAHLLDGGVLVNVPNTPKDPSLMKNCYLTPCARWMN